MNFDTLLSIAAFAATVGGLVPVFVVKENQRKQAAIAMVIALLLCLTGISAIRSVQRDRTVERMQANIVNKLSHHEWTFEQLLAELHYPEPAIFSEALFRAVAEGSVEDRLDQIQTKNEDLPVAIRLYHVPIVGETRRLH
jgi:apolipoprotein N-acyltransferase